MGATPKRFRRRSGRGALLLLLRLQTGEKIGCALRVGGCAEDRTLVFLQDVQPVPLCC